MSEPLNCPSCDLADVVPTKDGNCPTCGGPIVTTQPNVPTDRDTPDEPSTLDMTVNYRTDSDPEDATESIAADGSVSPTNGVPSRPPPPIIPRMPHHHSLELLGVGGMSHVYLGKQNHTNRPVAIKLLDSSFPSEGKTYKRFIAEMKALGQVNHPNVMDIVEVGDVYGRLYYTMECMADGSLYKKITKHKPANDFKQVARWLMQAARGVAAGHALGILHRDVKPSNLLLNSVDEAMVADYGLAKFMNEADGLTRTSDVIGTFNYASPEQAEGRIAQLDARSDVYSLGATLYHMLTGYVPFKAETSIEVCRKVIDEELPRPRSIHAAIPLSLERICVKAMEKLPSDRYESAEAFADDLERFLADQPPVGRPVSRLQKAKRVVHRNRVRVGMIATVLVVGLAVAVQPAPRKPPRPQEKIQAALQQGEEVVLVGATGRPDAYRWQIGEATLGPDDGIITPARFQTAELSRLVLVDDPMCDHYRITADFHHRSVLGHGYIGLFFGFNQMIDGQSLHHAVEVEWSEFYGADRNNPIGNGRVVSDVHRVVGYMRLYIPNKQLTTALYGVEGNYYFTPFDTKQRKEWRKIEIEVSPEGLHVWFQTDRATNTMADAMFIRRDIIEDRIAKQQAIYRQKVGLPISTELVHWSPRGPIGIFAARSTLSFRNVVLTPMTP